MLSSNDVLFEPLNNYTQLRFICLYLYSVFVFVRRCQRTAEIDLALTLISKFDLALINLFGMCCASETKSVYVRLKMTLTFNELRELGANSVPP